MSSRVRDVQGAQQSGPGRTERQRSPEQPGPKGNAQIQVRKIPWSVKGMDVAI
jgi:hypothetical protein